ncbi:MAG: MBL fold metallo-hydrolase [Gemmatimonadetes bacterium]|nr:MBL fold metallo-hydrolase [Gemmatimonadota bacterium]
MARPEIVCLTNGAFAENSYLVADPDSGDVALVDPGEEAGLIMRRVATQQWTPRAVWLTHAHLDHIAGVAEVVRPTGIEIYLHPDDRTLYDGVVEQGRWLGVRAQAPPPPDHALGDGDTVTIGAFSFDVVHVPGHSPGSVAFVGHGIAIVGDALFAGSVGRVDLPGGDGATLLKSITDRLLTLPDETIVYSGHGPATTIGKERTSNPFLTGAVPLV